MKYFLYIFTYLLLGASCSSPSRPLDYGTELTAVSYTHLSLANELTVTSHNQLFQLEKRSKSDSGNDKSLHPKTSMFFGSYKEVAEYTKEGNLWEFLGKNMTFGQKASLYWAFGACLLYTSCPFSSNWNIDLLS